MYLIGLTGNIAVGKSTVVAMLQTLGAAVLDADAVVHQLQTPAGAAYAPIVDYFGLDVVQGGVIGAPLDRAGLGRRVFADPNALKYLESIVHPLARGTMLAWVEEQRTAGVAVAVIDAIKLLEGGWARFCDAVWVVTASPEQQLTRLITQRGMSEADARQRIAAQGPPEAKLAHADVVIDNSGTLNETQLQVVRAWEAIPTLTKGGH